jgi:hypothetical protein
MELSRWTQLIEEARAVAAELSPGSPTRQVATTKWFDELAATDPPYGTNAPPLLLHLTRSSPGQLRQFDTDLDAVRAATPAGASGQGVLPFGLEIGEHAARQWCAGLMELAVQARLLHDLPAGSVELGPELPNGRRADARIEISGHEVWIEVSALSDDNQVISEFDTAKSVQVVHGDPYLDAWRVYRKAFDKVAGPAPELRSQLHPNQASVVVVGDMSWRSAGMDGVGFGWALDQLTDPNTRTDNSDASLIRWLEHDYPRQVDKALGALASMTAIAVVGGDLRLRTIRINTDPDEAHWLPRWVLDLLKQVLDPRPAWRRAGMAQPGTVSPRPRVSCDLRQSRPGRRR